MSYQLTPEQYLEFMNSGWFLACMIVVSIWSLIWKALALWRASRNYQKTWFAVLLVVNTMGILEILYLFVFSKRHNKGKELQGPQ